MSPKPPSALLKKLAINWYYLFYSRFVYFAPYNIIDIISSLPIKFTEFLPNVFWQANIISSQFALKFGTFFTMPVSLAAYA